MSQSQKPLSFGAGSLPGTRGLPVRLGWVVCEPQEPTVQSAGITSVCHLPCGFMCV